MQTATGWLARFGFSPESLSERLNGALTEIASRSAAVAAALASVTANSLLGLFFALLTLHVVFLHWDRMVARLEVLSPLRREYTRLLLAEFRLVGRATLLGTVATGAAQGAFATLGFWVTGIPDPLFFGIATAIASLVPAVGTLLVWVPAGLYLVATGHFAMGVALLAWGALVIVGVSDYVIRPRLVGDETMPTLLVFLALFGGVEVLGLRGSDHRPRRHGARCGRAPPLCPRGGGGAPARLRGHAPKAPGHRSTLVPPRNNIALSRPPRSRRAEIAMRPTRPVGKCGRNPSEKRG